MSDLEERSEKNSGDDMVNTPAGPRPRDKVHKVGRDEAVRRNDDGSYIIVPQTPPADGEKDGSDA